MLDDTKFLAGQKALTHKTGSGGIASDSRPREPPPYDKLRPATRGNRGRLAVFAGHKMPLISISPLGQLSVAQQLQVSQASRNRTIVLAQNKRHSLRGVSHLNNQEFYAYQEDEDDLIYVIDMAAYIDGANITQVARVPNGNTLTGTFHTTTRIAQRLKGFGRLDIRASLDTGEVEQVFLDIRPRANSDRKSAAY